METRYQLDRRTRLLVGLLLAIFVIAGGPAAAQTQPDRPNASTCPEQSSPGGSAIQAGTPEEHGLPQSAVEITRVFGLPVTNSMVVTWVVALGLIVFAHFATRHMQL